MIPPYVYWISTVQFILGLLITAINSLLLFSILSTFKLRSSTFSLLCNILLSNLLLGIIISISNVIDTSNILIFNKTEGTVSILNSFINLASLLVLVTSRTVTIRNPNKTMSLKTSCKIICSSWILILIIFLIKNLLYTASQTGLIGVCLDCFEIFELTSLFILAISTIIICLFSLYSVWSRKKRTVSDSSAVANVNNKEYKMAGTVGMIIVVFSLFCSPFVLLRVVWLIKPHLIHLGISEIIISIFYLHCLIDPIVIIGRDADVRKRVKAILRGQYAVEEDDSQEEQENRETSPNPIPNEPTAPPLELPPVETPPFQERTQYGSTDREMQDGRKIGEGYNPFDEP